MELGMLVNPWIYILDGCPCPHFDCPSLHPNEGTCEDPGSNWNFKSCEKILDDEEALCKAACETPKCYNECATKFVEGINSCPCGGGFEILFCIIFCQKILTPLKCWVSKWLSLQKFWLLTNPRTSSEHSCSTEDLLFAFTINFWR